MGMIITAEDLFEIPLPTKTESYTPVPHREVIGIAREELDKAGLTIINEIYHSAKEGKQAIGSYLIGNGDPEMNLKLMWHNSYDKTMPLRWAIGANVIVCGNGMVRGDIGAFKRRHTGTVLEDYRKQATVHIGKAGEMFGKLSNDREAMKNIAITKKTVAELMGRMYIEEGIVNATQLGIIRREIENPSYDYKADGSVWQIYNHVTVALKEAHPHNHIEQHIRSHNFFKKEFKLA